MGNRISTSDSRAGAAGDGFGPAREVRTTSDPLVRGQGEEVDELVGQRDLLEQLDGRLDVLAVELLRGSRRAPRARGRR